MFTASWDAMQISTSLPGTIQSKLIQKYFIDPQGN
jgi:hypothetical protein